MLKIRVRILQVKNPTSDEPLDYAALTNYDGQGSCEIIFGFRNDCNSFKDYLLPWADSVGWTVYKCHEEFHFKR